MSKTHSQRSQELLHQSLEYRISFSFSRLRTPFCNDWSWWTRVSPRPNSSGTDRRSLPSSRASACTLKWRSGELKRQVRVPCQAPAPREWAQWVCSTLSQWNSTSRLFLCRRYLVAGNRLLHAEALLNRFVCVQIEVDCSGWEWKRLYWDSLHCLAESSSISALGMHLLP